MCMLMCVLPSLRSSSIFQISIRQFLAPLLHSFCPFTFHLSLFNGRSFEIHIQHDEVWLSRHGIGIISSCLNDNLMFNMLHSVEIFSTSQFILVRYM